MKRRPWILVIFAVAHFLAPFFNLVFDAYLAKKPFWRYVELFFQPHNFSHHWFHFFAPMVAGIAIYACRKWTYLIYVSIMAALAFVSYASYLSRNDLSSIWPLLLIYGFNFLIVSYFLLPTVRTIYFDPRLRWWETKPRYSTNIECDFYIHGHQHSGVISNYSESGVFLKSSSIPTDHSFIRMQFQLDEVSYEFQGQVIRHGQQNSQGFGVQFFLNPQAKKIAKSLADRLQLKGLLQKDRAPSQEDTFLWWITHLFKTGQGLVPTLSRKPESSTKKS